MTVYMEVDETVNEKVFSIHGKTMGGELLKLLKGRSIWRWTRLNKTVFSIHGRTMGSELLNTQSTARFGGEDEF